MEVLSIAVFKAHSGGKPPDLRIEARQSIEDVQGIAVDQHLALFEADAKKLCGALQLCLPVGTTRALGRMLWKG